MKILILDLYRLMYRITGKSRLSVIITLVYITVLNLIAMYGLGILLEGLFRITSLIHSLFTRRLLPFTAIVMFLIDLWIMAPFKNIKKEKNKKLSYWGLIMYTGLAIIIFAYTKYGDRIPF